MKRSMLRILLSVFAFLLTMVVFSLNVPPGDFRLLAIMFAIAIIGAVLSLSESRKWKVVWSTALVISIVGGALEIVAGRLIAQQRSRDNAIINSTNEPSVRPQPGKP